MTDEEIRQIAKETGTPEAVIRTALPLIPVDKHSEWIGLLKLDNAASKMAHSYGWTVGHAISYIGGTSLPRKRSPMRLRFTIRDLLWLNVVAALAVGWWLANAKTTKIAQELNEYKQLSDKQQKAIDKLDFEDALRMKAERAKSAAPF
jgi:hypothetical protein